jgi:iron-sulfur cluster repair protein YtfE (RIC family)
MNAIELLEMDHDRISQLFDRIEEATEYEDRRKLFDEVRQELEAHSHVEENIFYPSISEHEEFRDEIEHYFDDHQEMKELIQEISGAGDESDFDNSMDELIEVVESHVDDEENELFPSVMDEIEPEVLEELGEQIEEARRNLPRAA